MVDMLTLNSIILFGEGPLAKKSIVSPSTEGKSHNRSVNSSEPIFKQALAREIEVRIG